jgi:hypothetical protein
MDADQTQSAGRAGKREIAFSQQRGLAFMSGLKICGFNPDRKCD